MPLLIRQPMLLVLKEKHDDRYFHVPDAAALYRVAIAILTERHRAGHWYDKPGTAPVAPDVTEASIAGLPQSLQGAAKSALRKYKREKAEHDAEVAEWARIEKAVAEKDGQAAWQILRARRQYEYEEVDLTHLEDVP